MKLIRALPSALCSRGSQKRPLYNPYSIATALTCASIGDIIPCTQPGTSSESPLARESSLATAQMSIGIDIRNAARTSWPVAMSNHSDPTTTFHLGCRGRTFSSRS